VLAAASAGWVLDTFLAPVLTGVAVGLALRAVAIFGEVKSNSLRAEELRIDLVRWVSDRDHQLAAETRGLTNAAGPQLYAGSLHNQLYAQMRHALHEYRDQASSAVRTYRRLARSEGWLHRRLRRASHDVPGPLTIAKYGHLILVGWRHLESPVPGTDDIVIDPEDDPSLAAGAQEIWPLETEPGITWLAASGRST